MNARARFIASFIAICVCCSMMMTTSIFLLPRMPMLRWVPLIALVAAFAAVYWLFRYYRNRLPPPTPEQRQRAIKANRRMAWIYLGGLAFGLITSGGDLLTLPHGVGFLLPLIPLGLATIHLRTAARLSRMATEATNIPANN